MPRGIHEALTAGNRNLCHLNSFQIFLIPGFFLGGGVSGELSQPNDIITSRKSCCHCHQFRSILWVDTLSFLVL